MILEEIGTEQGTSPRRLGRNLASWWYDNIGTLFSQHGLWSCDSSQTTRPQSISSIFRSNEFAFSSEVSTRTTIAMEILYRSEAAKYGCQVMGRS